MTAAFAIISAILLAITITLWIKQRKSKQLLAQVGAAFSKFSQGQLDANMGEGQLGQAGELAKAYNGMLSRVGQWTKAFSEEHARLEASINGLRIGLILTDRDRNIITLNGAAKAILYTRQSPTPPGLARSLAFLGLVVDMGDVASKLQGSFDFAGNLAECLKQNHDIEIGEVQYGGKFLNVFMSPVRVSQEQAIGLAITLEDVTEKKALERSRDEFFSIASHELRTPLTAIRGNTALIKNYYADQLKDPELAEMMEDIYQSSVRLIAIVNDFLNTSRLEQGRFEFKLSAMDVVTMANNVVKEYQVPSSSRDVKLWVEPPVAALPLAWADADRAREILVNLIGNALKYTSQGNVTVKFSHQEGFIKISVWDSGAGIPQASRHLLFHKFQQTGDPLTRDATQGTGLGLYISQLLVQGMGGEIWLEDTQVGKGSVFSFTLPIQTRPQSPAGSGLPSHLAQV